MAMAVNTSLGFFDPASEVEPKYDYFEGVVTKLSTANGLGAATQTSRAWVRMKLELVRYIKFGLLLFGGGGDPVTSGLPLLDILILEASVKYRVFWAMVVTMSC